MLPFQRRLGRHNSISSLLNRCISRNSSHYTTCISSSSSSSSLSHNRNHSTNSITTNISLKIPHPYTTPTQHHYSTKTTPKIPHPQHIYDLYLQNQQVLLSTLNLRPEKETDERVNTSWCPSVMLTDTQVQNYFGREDLERNQTEHYEETPFVPPSPSAKAPRKEIKNFQTFRHHQLVFVVKKSSPHIRNLGINPVIAQQEDYKLSPADRALLEERREVSLLTSDVLVAKTFLEKRSMRQPPKALLSGRLSMVEDLDTENSLWRECFDSHPHVHWKIKQKDVVFFRFRNAARATLVDLAGESFIHEAKALRQVDPDPLATFSRDFVKRLNHDQKLLQKICSKGYELDLSEKIVFDVDRYGIHVLGKDSFTEEWSEYYLEYGKGEQLVTQEEVQDFLFKMQTV